MLRLNNEKLADDSAVGEKMFQNKMFSHCFRLSQMQAADFQLMSIL
jgi:hypothetical protein